MNGTELLPSVPAMGWRPISKDCHICCATEQLHGVIPFLMQSRP